MVPPFLNVPTTGKKREMVIMWWEVGVNAIVVTTCNISMHLINMCTHQTYLTIYVSYIPIAEKTGCYVFTVGITDEEFFSSTAKNFCL